MLNIKPCSTNPHPIPHILVKGRRGYTSNKYNTFSPDGGVGKYCVHLPWSHRNYNYITEKYHHWQPPKDQLNRWPTAKVIKKKPSPDYREGIDSKQTSPTPMVSQLRMEKTLAAWLSWLEHHPIHQKTAGSIPLSGHVQEEANWCLSYIDVSLSSFHSLKSINIS